MKQLCLLHAGDVQKVCKVKTAQWSKCSKQAGQAEELCEVSVDYPGLKAIQESLCMASGVVRTMGNYV